MSNEKPAEKLTVEIEKPPAWAVSMAEKMETGFRGVRADIHLLDNSVGAVKERLIVLETWKKDSEERQAKHSGGIVRESQVNAEQSAAIAHVVSKVEALETKAATIETKADAQLALLGELKSVAANPMVRRIAYVVGGLVLAWLTAKGAR